MVNCVIHFLQLIAFSVFFVSDCNEYEEKSTATCTGPHGGTGTDLKLTDLQQFLLWIVPPALCIHIWMLVCPRARFQNDEHIPQRAAEQRAVRNDEPAVHRLLLAPYLQPHTPPPDQAGEEEDAYLPVEETQRAEQAPVEHDDVTLFDQRY